MAPGMLRDDAIRDQTDWDPDDPERRTASRRGLGGSAAFALLLLVAIALWIAGLPVAAVSVAVLGVVVAAIGVRGFDDAWR